MIHAEAPTGASLIPPQKRDQWFSDMIDTLRVDHFQLETNIASDDKKDMYSMFINGDGEQIMANFRKDAARHFIRKTLVRYLEEISKNEVRFQNIAFDLSRSTILVWAVVADDDEDAIDQLILAEAQANADSEDSEFSISTTVVEERDRISIPAQYRPLKRSFN